MKRILCIAMISALAACGRPGSDSVHMNDSQVPSIVGGQAVATNSPIAAHVVAIVGSTGDKEYLCTGVLISKDTVLTAAHCGANMRQGEVLFSTRLKPFDPDKARPIVDVKVQPRFAKTMGKLDERGGRSPNGIKNWGDLALMKFSGALPAGYQPVQIATSDDLRDGEPVILAGYGLLDGIAETPSRQLNSVTIEIKKARYSASEFTVDSANGKGPCHGDSGGPAFIVSGRELVLVGITSRGFDGVCTKATIYTRVAAFLNWINSSVKI